MSELEVINNTEDGRFEITEGGEVAFTEYRQTERGILFPHTLVPVSMEGRGVGGKLARAALAWARAHDQKVLPVCTFMAGFIMKHAEYHDLVHPLYRSALHLHDAELEEGLLESFPASDPPTATRREE